jgi:hypothetical protein
MNTANVTVTTRPLFPWFTGQIKLGIYYALYFLGIGLIMGAVFGLFGGLVLQPALFAASLIGIFCLMNFPASIIAVLVNLILAIFKKSSRPIYRYFGLSLGFALVYITYFYLLHLLHINVF